MMPPVGIPAIYLIFGLYVMKTGEKQWSSDFSPDFEAMPVVETSKLDIQPLAKTQIYI